MNFSFLRCSVGKILVSNIDYGFPVLARQSQSNQLYIPCIAKIFVKQVCWYSFNVSLVLQGGIKSESYLLIAKRKF